MTAPGFHPLVGQLLRGVGASEMEPPSPEVWRELLARMSQMYYETDLDRVTREQSAETSSRDMRRQYEELKQRTESERMEQEAIMRATLESAIEAILVSDNDRRVIAVNKQFARLSGLPE